MNLVDRFKAPDKTEFTLVFYTSHTVNILRDGYDFYRNITMSKGFEIMKELRRVYGAN